MEFTAISEFSTIHTVLMRINGHVLIGENGLF